MLVKKSLILFICLFSRSTESYEREHLVVWDIGQGSWATYITTTTCDHFDVGGDTSIPLLLNRLCLSRNNRLYLSHSDWDHISHLKDIYRKWRGFCLHSLPRDLFLKKPKTRAFIEKMAICNDQKALGPDYLIEEVESSTKLKRPNDLSRIFILNKKWLFPGDSTTAAEKVWAKQIKDPLKIEVLLLGHHGSRTSTSTELLNRLRSLRVAVGSARYKKYGHPHAEVREKLKQRKIPLLSTEEWGHLIFEL